MKLTPHFSLEELIFSSTAIARGINNSLPNELMPNIKKLAQGLEDVREVLGYPIMVSSGYRSPELNKAVGGAKSSSHMLAEAADFNCEKFGSIHEICRAIIKSGIKFDQLIKESNGRSVWVHIGFGAKMRQQVLTYKNGQYFNGLV